MAKACIILGSVIILFCGLFHLFGIFFSTDLHPADLELTEKLKSSTIQMDESGNLWKLWIGFNAMFSVGLIFMGSANLYLSEEGEQSKMRAQFILFLTVVSIAFFVWVGIRYMIRDFVISMLIPLLLFLTGMMLKLLKASHLRAQAPRS